MNIKKSAAIAMAKAGINQSELGRRLLLSPSTMSKQLSREFPNLAFVKMMADEFGMKVSEFIALGEE